LPLSFFWAGRHSYFSVANLTQAATGKYWSQAPYSFPNFTAAFRIFLTPTKWLKKMGYSIKFARNSLTYCSPSPCLFLEHRKNYKLNPLKLKNYGN